MAELLESVIGNLLLNPLFVLPDLFSYLLILENFSKTKLQIQKEAKKVWTMWLQYVIGLIWTLMGKMCSLIFRPLH